MSKHPRFPAVFAALFLLTLLCALAVGAQAEALPAKYADALKFVQKEQPAEAVAENVSWNPKQLAEVRGAMPEGAVFRFSCKWNGLAFADDSEELDLNKAKKTVSGDSLRAILSLCPKLRLVDNSSKRNPSNDVFIPLIEEYPEIRFEWVVHLRGDHYCPTDATAYSTLNHTDYGTRLKSEDLELLKYVPGLKALDLGHNAFTDLSFLRFYPDLELLIISNNEHVDDLTEVGKLRHLKYLEVHNTNVSDLSPLSGCTELLDLNVSSTRVTDLSPLDGVSSLERFWANALKKLPESEQARFKELHPDCTADFTVNGSAVSHKWREHERFYRFRRCFKHKMWVPFDEPWPED